MFCFTSSPRHIQRENHNTLTCRGGKKSFWDVYEGGRTVPNCWHCEPRLQLNHDAAIYTFVDDVEISSAILYMLYTSLFFLWIFKNIYTHVYKYDYFFFGNDLNNLALRISKRQKLRGRRRRFPKVTMATWRILLVQTWEIHCVGSHQQCRCKREKIK